jgi:hypothetical protein
MELSSDSDILPVLWTLSASVACVQAVRSAQKHSRLLKHGGSWAGKAINRDIGRLSATQRLDVDYFARNERVRPVFSNEAFERRFRMLKEIFEKPRGGGLLADKGYFSQKSDAVGGRGTITDPKITAALRQLSFGVGADTVVEYIRLSESTVAECLKRFCAAVVSEFKG